jgi:hypothetical protein
MLVEQLRLKQIDQAAVVIVPGTAIDQAVPKNLVF